MTVRVPLPPRPRFPGRYRPPRPARPVAVQLLLCGTRERADDGAAIAAGSMLAERLPADVRVRIVSHLEIDHLLAVPDGATAVIVDTAVGIPAGQIIDLPLDGLLGRDVEIRPRSCHALAIPEVVGLVGILRGHQLLGRIILIGGSASGRGRPMSRRVSSTLAELADTILRATSRYRAGGIVA